MQPEPAGMRRLTATNICWLSAGMVMCILPHSRHLPAWVIVLSLLLIGIRLMISLDRRFLPVQQFLSRGVLQTVMVLAGFAGILVYYHTLVGRDAGTALLVLLAGFKVLETFMERDFYIAIFLGLFVTITNFFYTQSIIIAVYMTVTVLVMFTTLVSFNDRNPAARYGDSIRTAGTMLIQSFPLMLVLFLLFPRINGPLWGLPKDAHAGLIGISDEMEPGSISKLIRSNAVAFRVEFDGEIPPHNKLYWRGPVLWYTDGRKWTREPVSYHEPPHVDVSGSASHYTITMEPTNKPWLFALEMPQQAPATGYISYDYEFRSRTPVQQRIRYKMSSYTDYRLGTSDSYELRRALQFPLNAHKKAIKLARSWRKKTSRPEEIINLALRMFSQENFYYTLSPPPLTFDNVDDFLFGTRRGFCEHYAAAFVILMRAAGIPARVVTGYQGGVYNPVGNYLIVYQRDAHAWAEVWLDDKGWVRVDPTSVVSPARVEEGIEDALPGEVTDMPGVFSQSLLSRNLWQKLRNTWDAVNNQWNQWFISYGPERQTLFLRQFGMEKIDYGLLTLLLLVSAGLLLLVTAWLLFRQQAARPDQARRVYDRFCRKLESVGIQRRPYEGPLDFAARASRKKKTLAEKVNMITALYVQVRYASQSEKLPELEKQVNIFRPKKLLVSGTGWNRIHGN